MLLSSVSWLYGKIADIRNSLYQRGVLKSHSLGAKTISIGNITAGGTGKTPLVMYVAEILAEAGEKVCVLTRGYGRVNPRERVLVSDGNEVLVDARTGGDEPVEMARKLAGNAVVVADADRVSAAAWARGKFGVSAFVLDDGFQHRRAKRDLDIVCIDATDPFGSDNLLPGGTLREPLNNLSRADAIVLTRTELVDDLRETISRIGAINVGAPIFRSRSVLCQPIALDNFLGTGTDKGEVSPAAFALAFCALGNPQAFFESIRQHGYHVEDTHAFRDHHYYTQDDIETIEHGAREREIDVLLTTAKDAVKLKGLNFSISCFVLEIQIEIDDADALRDLIISS